MFRSRRENQDDYGWPWRLGLEEREREREREKILEKTRKNGCVQQQQQPLVGEFVGSRRKRS